MSFLSILTGTWAAETAVLVVLLIYRAVIGMKEDDRLFLTAGQTSVEREQHEIQAKIVSINKYATILAIVSGLLLIAMGSLWAYQQLNRS